MSKLEQLAEEILRKERQALTLHKDSFEYNVLMKSLEEDRRKYSEAIKDCDNQRGYIFGGFEQ